MYILENKFVNSFQKIEVGLCENKPKFCPIILCNTTVTFEAKFAFSFPKFESPRTNSGLSISITFLVVFMKVHFRFDC
jgi:hypothetical protein